ncbi:divalent-cation tolerance protein CutA [Kitasatospora sp. CB01950]|uniref:divalent-cation tolerance protein CutA n=1 Tax=Kitasatospora sp. CB01950 TaxID=1703930 RepID=UPI00093BEB70|nr:divalent-cation tolerance protein CutA [Kitasatospora sp. CB01950]OKJ16115.1 cytochrome C biogenesis protein [Kitasatospora sp. CB01950]
MTEPQHLVVTTTHDDEDAARALAATLVSERLAACAQVHAVRSVYWWDGEVQDTAEWRVDLKTRASLAEQLADRIVELHPYDTPEVIAVPITAGASGYLAWLSAETAAR